MKIVYLIHAILGEFVLPLLIVVAAIWLVVTWKPDAPRGLVARLFPVLVDIQVTLGLIYWIYKLVSGESARYLSFPFILHPLVGILAAMVAHLAMRPRGLVPSLGRWAPMASLALLLVMVIANVLLAGAV